MNFKKLKDYWHDVYYAVVSEKGVHFAMTCKDVTEKIDLGQIPKSYLGRARFYLHLSLCHACDNYFKASKALGRAIRELVKNSQVSTNTDRLDKELLKKYTKPQ